MIACSYPGHNIRIINKGISGNTTRDLKARWQTDALDLQPDWVSVLIGINDVWRQFDSPKMPEAFVLPDEYRENMREMVAATRDKVLGMVLMTPFIVENNTRDAMRARIDEYNEIVHNVADEFDCLFADSQTEFVRLLQYQTTQSLASDREHPGMPGHLALARAFLNAVEFKWN